MKDAINTNVSKVTDNDVTDILAAIPDEPNAIYPDGSNAKKRKVRLSPMDYATYTMMKKCYGDNGYGDFYDLSRTMFLAGQCMPSFNPETMTEFVLKCIQIIRTNRKESFETAKAQMVEMLDKGWNIGFCKTTFYRFNPEWERAEDGHFRAIYHEEQDRAKAIEEATTFLKRLYEQKRNQEALEEIEKYEQEPHGPQTKPWEVPNWVL